MLVNQTLSAEFVAVAVETVLNAPLFAPVHKRILVQLTAVIVTSQKAEGRSPAKLRQGNQKLRKRASLDSEGLSRQSRLPRLVSSFCHWLDPWGIPRRKPLACGKSF